MDSLSNLRALLTKKNIATLAIFGILVLAIPLGVGLIRQSQIIRSRATGESILVYQKSDGSALPVNESGVPITDSLTVRLSLTAPLLTGSPAPTQPPAQRRIYQFLIGSDGNRAWQRTCDTTTGSPRDIQLSQCPFIETEAPLNGIIPGYTQGFRSVDTTSLAGGKLYQFLVGNNGTDFWQRTCDSANNSGNPHDIPSSCGWGEKRSLPFPVRSIDTTSLGGGKLYQFLIGDDGKTAWQRTRDTANNTGNPHDIVNPTEWGASFQLTGVIPGFGEGFNSIDTTSLGGGKLYQFLIYNNGNTAWQRTCDTTDNTGSPANIVSGCQWSATDPLNTVVSGYTGGFRSINTTVF